MVGILYRPPNGCNLDILEEELDEVMVHYKNVILLGDLNADMCVSENKSEEILELCGSLGLHLINYSPTHHTTTSHT